MAGSLFEIVADSGGPYTASAVTNPGVIADDGTTVRRGGSYGWFAHALRAVAREGQYGAANVTWQGFRCAR